MTGARSALEGTFATDDGNWSTPPGTLLKHDSRTTQSRGPKAKLCSARARNHRGAGGEIATSRAVTVSITYGLDHYVNGYLSGGP